jgi:PUA domain protein
MPEKSTRHFLKTKEAVAFLSEASEKLKVNLEQILKTKIGLELIKTEFAEIYIINNKPLLVKIQDQIFPTLAFEEYIALSPKVYVDMGAVPHVCNGANIMAPGIRRIEGEFKAGDFVIILDEKHSKPIAAGEIMYDSAIAKEVTYGVVVKNIHYVGDRVWDFVKKFGT